jgi:flagellar basal-body rod protein FlgB
MIFKELNTAGSMPVLEQTLAFAGARQRILTHNIANIDTPDFRPTDLSVQGFRAALSQAVDRRRAAHGGEVGTLNMARTNEIEPLAGGRVRFKPRTNSPGVLYHDRNNRDVERLMQGLAENGLAYRVAGDLWRRQNDLLRTAISQRV